MNLNQLNISLIQTKLFWKDATANRAMLEEKIWKTSQDTHLIVLPEMFTTGFTMDASECAEPMNLHTFKWMQQMAAQRKAVIIGSYIVKEDTQFFNRLICMFPDGSYQSYDKRHLFRMANEHHTYSPGTEQCIIEWKGWKIMPLVCYDLRFPVWSRNTNLQYDVLIYVANWPQARRSAWNTLLSARAIENLCYTVGVNRVGEDGNQIPYSGDSSVYDFKGQALFHNEAEEMIHMSTLSYEDLLAYRAKFPAHLDADSFSIE